jgi:hypothetical protein
MRIKSLYVTVLKTHAPLYYFNLFKVKEIDEKIWLSFLTEDELDAGIHRRNKFLSLKYFKSALLKSYKSLLK